MHDPFGNPRTRSVLSGLALVMAAAGCQRSSPDTPPPPSSSQAKGDTAPSTPSPEDPVLAAIAERLPTDWSGIGTLEVRQNAPPGAPPWGSMVADVIDEADGRYLRATGLADRITNVTLARTTAAARARAALAGWMGTNRLLGTEVAEHWGVPGGPTLALVRVRVPSDWQPGRPLPADPSPPTPQTNP